MNDIKVKICGLTRPGDVAAAVDAGAEILGFVFTKSPRQIDTKTARQLLGHVPPGILRVGLFLDQGQAEVKAVIDSVTLDLLQFHGRESEAECARYGLPWIKAVAMEIGRAHV